MPFSFQPYGITAILVMIGLLSVIELVKYLRSKKQAESYTPCLLEGQT